MSSLVILADDLTGACDAAAPFAARGIATDVVVGAGRTGQAAVAAFNLDLRDRSAEETYNHALEAGRKWRNAAELFVKIDSTLRGCIGEFVCGVQDGVEAQTVVVAPAFPRNGRMLVNGRLRLAGSEKDGADLPLAFGNYDREIVHVGTGPDVQKDIEAAAIAPAGGTKRIVIADAATEADLIAVARAVIGSGGRMLMAGSGGLAEARASLAPACKALPLPFQAVDGPILILSGSPAQATLDQIEYLAGQGSAEILDLSCKTANLNPERPVQVIASARCGDGPIERDGERSSEQLALCASNAAEAMRPAALIMVGGSSARAICERLGVEAIAMQGQALGLPFGALRGGVWDGVPVVTKPGGFGDRELLQQLVQWLAEKGKAVE